jgi:ligand-binding SRPBCC domain-containing protein
MPVFTSSVIIGAPVETVFAFHERADALRLLSPPFPPVRVVSKTGGIEPGSRVELNVGPFRWVALHTGFEKNRFFEDTQISGPFAKWIHRHEFESVGASTLLTDRVEYELRGKLLIGWAVRLGMAQMFRYRHAVTKRYCERGVS